MLDQVKEDNLFDINPNLVGKNIPPFKFALMLDGAIVDVLFAEERVAKLCLSNFTVIDVTEKIKELESLGLSLIDATYDSETEEFVLASQY